MSTRKNTDFLTQDSSGLYAACGSSNPAEQASAYRELWAYLFRVASYMTRSQLDGDALAQDCAQQALLRVHQQYDLCKEPAAFRAWTRRIVSNLVIDELRRQRRLQPMPEQEATLPLPTTENLETAVLQTLTAVSLRQLLQQAPISDRSRRVVIGRYLDDLPDEHLAEIEGNLANQEVLASHVQVTRAKNIVKLRQWPALGQFLREAG